MPEPAVPSVIAMIFAMPLGRDGGTHGGRMDVDAVADDLGRDQVALEDGADEAGLAMAERRHAVEQVRRVTRARGDAFARLRVGGARMAERDAVAVLRRGRQSGRGRRRSRARR